MSTKIYDAYQINVPSTHKLHRFIKDIQRLYLERKVRPELNKLIFNKLEYLTQYLTVHNNAGNKQLAENVIKYAANYAYPKNLITPNDFSLEEAILRLHDIPVMSVVYDVIETEMRIAANDRTIMTAKYDFAASIAIFTYKKRQFIMAFGNHFTDLLSDILTSDDPEYTQFREKYNLKDYHYQNQTDQPEDISDEDWNDRRHTWDILLPTGVPAKDGICINISDNESIISDTWSLRFSIETYEPHIANVLSNKKSTDDNIQKYATDFARDSEYKKYVADNPNDTATVSHYIKFDRQFNADLKSEKETLIKLIDDYKLKIKRFIFDFDKAIENEVRKNSIIEFLNNHSDENNRIGD